VAQPAGRNTEPRRVSAKLPLSTTFAKTRIFSKWPQGIPIIK
jgi:hypothetical protein